MERGYDTPTVRRLSIDTSTLTSSVALVHDENVLCERARRGEGSHASQLIDLVHDVLRGGGLELAQVDALVVGLGPGSFTGVRVGVSVAKGLGLALERPVFGACTLSALASAGGLEAGLWGAPVLAMLDARRGEVFFAIFLEASERRRVTLLEPSCASPERAGQMVGSVWPEPHAVRLVGDLDDALRARVMQGALERNPSLRFDAPIVQTPQARWIAAEARSGRAWLDEGSMEPRYVRPMDAKLPARPQAGR
jgi:tRNA threonylcarbamoyladenosine biosynthesis protein TsaB